MRGRARGLATVGLVCLAAVTVVAGCGDPEETGGTPSDEAPLALQLPASGSARCGATDARVLARADHAFDGRVEEVTGTDVTLTVDAWFAGGEEVTVLVTTLRGARSTERFPTFVRGERYLVAASGTQVMVCGYTGRWQPRLARLYQDAFGGPG